MGREVALLYAAPQRRHVGRRLLDPVPPGDPEVEQALGHVLRDLLGTQDAHLDTRGSSMVAR
jgi:hypothetical protein